MFAKFENRTRNCAAKIFHSQHQNSIVIWLCSHCEFRIQLICLHDHFRDSVKDKQWWFYHEENVVHYIYTEWLNELAKCVNRICRWKNIVQTMKQRMFEVPDDSLGEKNVWNQLKLLQPDSSISICKCQQFVVYFSLLLLKGWLFFSRGIKFICHIRKFYSLVSAPIVIFMVWRRADEIHEHLYVKYMYREGEREQYPNNQIA